MNKHIITLSLLFVCPLFSTVTALLPLGGGWVGASERTILIGPKTIGAGWKDNVVIKAEQFAGVQVSDIITVYNDRAKGNAQGAFQDPKDWKGIAQEYGYFGIAGPFRMTVTEEILPKLKERGVAIGGHDYRILKVTHTPAADIVEKTVWRGPAKLMKDDWSVYADVEASAFKDLHVGDGLRFHVSRVQPGAAIKLCDFTYNALDASVNGAPVGGDAFTYYVTAPATIVQLTQLKNAEGISMRVSGKGYRLDKIGIVQQVGGVDEDETTAQRCPPEYILGPGELFRGEKEFPMDWSGNLRITAEAFQECTENDCLVISYRPLSNSPRGGEDSLSSGDKDDTALRPSPQRGERGEGLVLSLREQRKWHDLTGAEEPVWYDLDGSDLVYMLDNPVALDNIKTKGFVLTGRGFVLTKIELVKVQ